MKQYQIIPAAIISVAINQVCVLGIYGQDQQSDPLPPVNSQVEPIEKSSVRIQRNGSNPITTPEKMSLDQEAIFETGKSYAAAYSKGDAQAAAGHYTADAEYVDADGNRFQGRDVIQGLLAEFMEANPGCKLSLEIESIRLISPGVAIEDGLTVITFAGSDDPLLMGYTAVHVKHDGRWLTASLRERSIKNPREHRAQLRQLDWMLGDWVHEGDNAIVRFSCRAVDNGNFLVRTFSVQVAGNETMSGSQRIGWDTRAAKFRAWVFDSDGGYSEGYFHRDGDNWVLKQVGVTSDGQAASSTSIYSPVNERTMTFQSVDHEIGGSELPDSEPVTIVRQSPKSE